MARSSTGSISSSLALNLSAAIILWILLTLVGVMLFLVWEARLSADQQVNLEGEVVGAVAANACVLPLLENDYPAIRARLQSMVDRLPDVAFCLVDSVLPGSVGAEISVGEPDAIMRWMEGDRDGIVVFETPIHMSSDERSVIGTVAIGYLRARIDSSLHEKTWKIAAGIGASFFIVAMFLVFVIQRVIGRPLSDLDRQASQLAEGDLHTPIHLESQTEFGHLAQTLETMRIRIAGQIQHLEGMSEQIAMSNKKQKMMFSELDHRVRNNLAGLASLITLSRQGADDVDDFAGSISGRVHAMSIVHTLLSQEHWDPIDLEELIRLLVPPGIIGKLELEGSEKVLVPSKQATACGMVIQELMANSIKYGAWSSNGVVRLHWRSPVRTVHGNIQVILHWQETGGPPIIGEVVPGTGVNLIEGFITSELGGEATFRFEPEGARHDFIISIPEKSGT